MILQNSLIAACQKAGQWHRALQLLAELPSKALQPTVVSYNTAISACATVWQIAMMLAHRTDVQRDVITFNAAMSSLDQDVLQWQRAFHLFLSLRRNDLLPSVVTCSTAMSVVGHRWDVALHFLETSDLGVRADVVMYSAGINACGKCQEWEQALWTLASCKRRELQPHVVAYNTVISTLAECRWEVALLIFHEALMYSRPDVITYNAAISASAAGSCWQAALHFLTSAKEGLVQCDAITYNAAMSSCESKGLWQGALALLADMTDCGLKPDVISFDTAMSACDKAEQWQQAVELLLKLREASLKEDAVTCSTLVSACVKGEEWALALWFIAHMQNIERDVFVYTGAMSAYEKSNDHWHGALLVFDHLMCSFLEVDLVARNAIISACTEAWQIALALFSGSDHCDEISFNALLGACSKGEKTRQSSKECAKPRT